VARYHAEYVAEHVQEKVTVMYLGGADLIEKYFSCITLSFLFICVFLYIYINAFI
jgi:hypothetical protein